MLNYFPKYFTSKAVYLYMAALFVVSVLFFNKVMSLIWWLFGIGSVFGFFYYSNLLTRKWSVYPEKIFTKRLFKTALIIRITWVIVSYLLYIIMTGVPFEFSAADAHFYDEMGRYGSNLIWRGHFPTYIQMAKYAGTLDLSDYGYPLYLSLIYSLTGKSILITRLIKAILSALTCLFAFRLTKRNFGEETGRMAAILCMLMPNLIYYVGIHLKETEMVFLAVAFLERADFAMRSTKLSFKNLILPVLLAASLFFFRTVLGATALFAFATALMLSTKRAVKKKNRLVLILWVLLVMVYFLGGRLATEVEEVWADRNMNQQQSLEWRAQREGGNQLARFATKSVFAPMIMVIPFPTMIETPGQENQRLIHGGNYVKNIMAFFAMFALLMIIIDRKWRDYLLLGSYMLGYLLVVALSAFAHSERFHLPALPVLLIFAAYGISRQENKHKKYFTWWMMFIFVAIVGWSWFKLAGRGMV
ncbi:MAG: glycosyltransferase family 39 protein [Pigmentiphaga sp.]|nr:glycosyltransferase family 39 protein [Pigmentiphaga sp.]